MRFLLLVIMTGLGFTFGLLFGLFLQLPSDTMPSSRTWPGDPDAPNSRHRRSLDVLSGRDFAQGEQADSKAGNHFDTSLQGSVAKQIPVSPRDPVIAHNSFVANTNMAGGGKFPVFEAARAQLSRNLAQVQSKIGEDKYNSPTIHSGEKKPVSLSHVDDATLQIKQKKASSQVDDGAKPAEKVPETLSASLETEGNKDSQASSVSVRLRIYKNGTHTQQTGNEAWGDHQARGNQADEPAWKLEDVFSGAFWNKGFEDRCPQRFTSEDLKAWRRKAEALQVVKMEEGCGRMQNRLLTFRDASKACARYRLNTDQIQGDIYSYYLANLLNITNLPPSAVLSVNSLDDKWRTVHLDLAQAQWADDKVIVATQWLDGLTPAFIPHELRESNRKIYPGVELLTSKSQSDLCDLVQWSDLVVFDYLTANLDRVVNNMFNRQWNDQMMNNPAHNLERMPSGNLVFLDNESGLFHGYRLLDKYDNFHKTLLQSLCVFRRSTAEAVRKLYKSNHIGEELHKLFSDSESLHTQLPRIPEKNVKILKQRLKDVYDQISKCETQNGR